MTIFFSCWSWLINEWFWVFVYLRNAVSETACLYMLDEKERKLMCYCTITLFPRQVSLFSFSYIWLLPWALLDCFFPELIPVWCPSLVSHWEPSPRTQLAPQPCISHHYNLFLSYLITCSKPDCSDTSDLHWVSTVFLKSHCYPLRDGITLG